jgi:hypothetical protein
MDYGQWAKLFLFKMLLYFYGFVNSKIYHINIIYNFDKVLQKVLMTMFFRMFHFMYSHWNSNRTTLFEY